MLKKVGTYVYVHKSNLGEMINKCFSKEDLSYLKNAFYKYIEIFVKNVELLVLPKKC